MKSGELLPIILLGVICVLVLVFLSVMNPGINNTQAPVTNIMSILVPNFIDGFITYYIVFNSKNKDISSGILIPGSNTITSIKNGYIQINIEQESDKKTVNTYIINNGYSGSTTGVLLTKDDDDTIILPSKIYTIINNIPTQITL